MTMPDDLSALRKKPFADAVSKFESLTSQSRVAFLLGAGCSKCAGLPLTDDLTEKAVNSGKLDDATKSILEALRKLYDGAQGANIEDYLSEVIDLLAVADRRDLRGAAQRGVRLGESDYDATRLRHAVEQIKRGIAEAFDCKVPISTHREFVRAVHRPLRPGKKASGEVVDYLILNYDTMLEDALALERIRFSDGLDGGATGWWNPSTFDREDLDARVIKLHGSINWCELPGDPLPRRVGPGLELGSLSDMRILIWPASTKYRETQFDPYAQLTDRARQVLRPSRDAQRVLIACGYRFADSHINLEIGRALRESDGHLTMIAFTSEEQPVGQLKQWHEDRSVTDQLLIFANKGFFHGSNVLSSSEDLVWWKFENVVRLLGGER